MPYKRLLFRVTFVAVVLYWLAIFTGTHLPKMPEAVDLQHVSDKTLHFGAYAGLTVLLCLLQTQCAPWNFWVAGRIFGIDAAYGVIDELSQTLVGRQCSIYDWGADLLGSGTGLLLFSVAHLVWTALRPTRPGSELVTASARSLPEADAERFRVLKPRSR